MIYIERFKVAAEKKGEFDYFGIYKIKIPKGMVVTALQVKNEIEQHKYLNQILTVLALAHVYDQKSQNKNFEHPVLENLY